jgi:nucleotide-binding universal stress UspA family protein
VAGPEVVRDQVAHELREEHRGVQALAETLRAAGIDATALLIQGPIIDTILSEAKRFEADMLIVGSHGFGALYDLLVGSSSRGILKNCDIPVLVVPVR